ncbi:MAG: hypothetical protein PT936_01785 [Treponema sp.]|nr:hypothetical protein [Treponema sp.]
MKNRFFKNIARVFAIVAGCLMLASFSPSLDGRAIVVDEGVFPSGLFAKTVGYLPGDIISVTNITGDATIDILVIGALDPSEGVAIMLSPEAATAIGMDKEANNIVKITKRSNQDERVYGTAIIARQDGNTTIPAVTVPDNEVPAKEESFANVEPATENEFNVGNQETTIDNSEPDDETPEVIEDVADDNSEGVIVEEINNGEEYVPDEEWEDDSYEESDDSDDEYSEDIYEDNNEVEDSENDKVEELEEEIKEEEIAAEEYEEEYLPEEDVEAEEYTEDDYIPEDDDITDYEEETETDDFDEDYIETEVEDDYDDVIEEEYTEEDIPADEEYIEEEFDEDAEEVLEVEHESEAEIEDPIEEEFEEFEEEIVEDELVEDEIIEDEIIEDEILEDEIIEDEEELPEEQLSEEEFIEEPEEIEEEVLEDEIQDDAEEYDAIVLVPAEENISSVIEETESLEAENEVVEEIVEETEVAEEIEQVILEEVHQIVEETKTVETNTSYSKYVVPNMSDLKKGSYYIQIAVLKSDENILEVTNKYGKKYPLTIVPNADGTKKVMVGPLCVDEYGTVLERFKSYGYKDAFTRKIN